MFSNLSQCNGPGPIYYSPGPIYYTRLEKHLCVFPAIWIKEKVIESGDDFEQNGPGVD